MKCENPDCGALFLRSRVFGTHDRCPFCHALIDDEGDDGD